MKLYHGTTEEAWKEIQEEGVLWGRKNTYWMGNLCDRITWLAVKKEHAGIYDYYGITNTPCVLLEVDVDENTHWFKLEEGCWQITTYDPIPLSKVKRINQ